MEELLDTETYLIYCALSIVTVPLFAIEILNVCVSEARLIESILRSSSKYTPSEIHRTFRIASMRVCSESSRSFLQKASYSNLNRKSLLTSIIVVRCGDSEDTKRRTLPFPSWGILSVTKTTAGGTLFRRRRDAGSEGTNIIFLAKPTETSIPQLNASSRSKNSSHSGISSPRFFSLSKPTMFTA
jgi:hypothetical protein